MTADLKSDSPLAALSVVIVLYNSADVIEGCLRSIPDGVQTIVVDNASTDGGAARAQAIRPDVQVVVSDRNRGFGGGCNLGWRQATRPYVAFVNPDVRLRDDALGILVRRLAAEGRAIVGPALLDAGGAVRGVKRRPSGVRDVIGLLPTAERWAPAIVYGEMPRTHPVLATGGVVDCLEGACFVLRRADLEAIGGFDEDLFLYYEEESLAQRIAALGGRAIYEPQAVAEHAGGTSTAKVAAMANRHLHRSRIVFYRKRDGDRRAWLIALGLVAAARLSQAVAALNRRMGRPSFGSPEQWRGVLGGMREGLAAPLHEPARYPASG